MADTDAQLRALGGILPPLLSVLEGLNWVARQMHPPDVPALAEALAGLGPPFVDAAERFGSVAFPPQLAALKGCIVEAADCARRALEALAAAAEDGELATVYRVLGQRTRAMAALYPAAAALPPVNRFFLDRERRGDEALVAKLAAADGHREGVGVMHADNERDQRGGWSLYVPEYYDAKRRYPLIVALHGGSGHGRDFLWTWLASARGRGAILLSPTAIGRTWALEAPEADVANIEDMVQHVAKHWRIDPARRLLTGMSDGGTFCYLAGLRADSPFTHLAPSSASFNAFLMVESSQARLAGLPIYLLHGARDWMFPVATARKAKAVLRVAGAAVTYRKIKDLSHTWPQEENPRILDWLDATPAPGN